MPSPGSPTATLTRSRANPRAMSATASGSEAPGVPTHAHRRSLPAANKSGRCAPKAARDLRRRPLQLLQRGRLARSRLAPPHQPEVVASELGAELSAGGVDVDRAAFDDRMYRLGAYGLRPSKPAFALALVLVGDPFPERIHEPERVAQAGPHRVHEGLWRQPHGSEAVLPVLEDEVVPDANAPEQRAQRDAALHRRAHVLHRLGRKLEGARRLAAADEADERDHARAALRVRLPDDGRVLAELGDLLVQSLHHPADVLIQVGLETERRVEQ